MKYLTFDFDFGSRSQSFVFLPLYGYYMGQICAKLIKPFRIYRNMKYLTFDFDL